MELQKRSFAKQATGVQSSTACARRTFCMLTPSTLRQRQAPLHPCSAHYCCNVCWSVRIACMQLLLVCGSGSGSITALKLLTLAHVHAALSHFPCNVSRPYCIQGSDGPEAAQAAARQELQLTQAALGRNPKSYGSWHHRKWVIQMRLVSLDDELNLVKQ